MSDALPYRVVVVRQDGRERLFQAYATRDEAQAVADHLCKVTCPARVADPAELAFAEGRRE